MLVEVLVVLRTIDRAGLDCFRQSARIHFNTWQIFTPVHIIHSRFPAPAKALPEAVSARASFLSRRCDKPSRQRADPHHVDGGPELPECVPLVDPPGAFPGTIRPICQIEIEPRISVRTCHFYVYRGPWRSQRNPRRCWRMTAPTRG